MKDDLNFKENGRRPNLFLKMEDKLNYFENGRRSQFFENGRRLHKKNKKIMQPQTFQIKTMVVAPLRVT